MLRDIVIYPSPVLREPTLPVETLDWRVLDLIRDLQTTMYALDALGIAAPQIGRKERVFLLDGRFMPGGKDEPLVFINPEILEKDKKMVTEMEGCLSFPTVFLPVPRPRRVVMRAQDQHGETRTWVGEGLLGRAMLHEYDHLFKTLMVDRVSILQRDKAFRQVRSWREKGQAA